MTEPFAIDDDAAALKKTLTMDMSETKNCVKRWLELDREIKELQKKILTMKKEKTQINDQIIVFMQKNDIPFFNLNSEGQLRLHQRQCKEPLSQKKIQEMIQSSLEGEQASALKALIFDNRPLREVSSLRYKTI